MAQKSGLSLELDEASVKAAVGVYIQHKVDELAQLKEYDRQLRDDVYNYLLSNANDTFLWVALVCQDLTNTESWNTPKKLRTFPPELNPLYSRMMKQICDSENAELCKRILAVVSVVYRPVTLDELTSLVDMPNGVSNDKSLTKIIGLCGSFLTLRERTISFVHKSAKDFLVDKASEEIFPSGMDDVHRSIFSRSLQAMSSTLRRDVYSLGAPGFPIDRVEQPEPDPLAKIRYSCIYWVDHLHDCDPTRNTTDVLQDGGSVDKFLRRSYLYWLEVLSLERSISQGILSMAKLKDLLQVRRIHSHVKLY